MGGNLVLLADMFVVLYTDVNRLPSSLMSPSLDANKELLARRGLPLVTVCEEKRIRERWGTKNFRQKNRDVATAADVERANRFTNRDYLYRFVPVCVPSECANSSRARTLSRHYTILVLVYCAI